MPSSPAADAPDLRGYRAVREGVGVADRGDRTLIRVTGRQPVQMVQGLITNDLARAAAGRAVYAAMLTPKGRTLAELRAFRHAAGDGTDAEAVLLDVPTLGLAEVEDQLRKFLPPRLARWERAADLAMLGLYGPDAPTLAAGLLPTELPRDEDEWTAQRWGDHDLWALATRYAGGELGFDLIGAPAALAEVAAAAAVQGAIPVDPGSLDALRIEAGRPRFGPDITGETIPTEAWESTGQMGRGVSFNKGCYTGQEVIVRIAHRGHVNRHLRGLLLGSAPAPEARTALLDPASGREVGWTTSATWSPLLAQTISLGYVRREWAPGAELALGAADGAVVRVAELPFRADP